MKNITIKIVDIIFIIGVIIVIGISFIKSNKYNKKEEIKNEYIEKLRDSLNKYKFQYDSIIKIQNYTIDSLKNIKKNTIVIYEQAESAFSDRNIISGDSILRYIAKKIQD